MMPACSPPRDGALVAAAKDRVGLIDNQSELNRFSEREEAE